MMSLRTTCFLLLAAALGTAARPAAQSPLHAQFAAEPSHDYGRAAAGLGDVDGDGVRDYAVGAPRQGADPGYVVVYSGATGAEIRTLEGNGGVGNGGNSDRFGSSVAGIADVDGDGVEDVLVGAPLDHVYGPNRGVAQVLSGSDGSLVREHFGVLTGFGVSVAALGDADGDGVGDYLAAERQDRVHAFSGATGQPLWTFESGFFDLAIELSPRTGDANGDGVPDAVVGAPGTHPSVVPYVVVLDGASGAELHRIEGSVGSGFGRSVSWVGDVNGDGADEFATLGVFSGELDVFDGSSGVSLYTVTGTVALHGSMCGLGDQDGDGVPDFAADDSGAARLFSGADGALLAEYDVAPMALAAAASTALVPVGDLDGDGREELLETVEASQAAIVFSATTYPLEDLGFGLAGSLGEPRLTAEGSLLPGSVLRTQVSNAQGLATTLLIGGLQAVYEPALDGTLVPYPQLLVDVVSPSSGQVDYWCVIPPGIPAGTEIFWQHWVNDPSAPCSWTASNAVRGVFP